MARPEFTTGALNDIEDIWKFICSDSYESADRVEVAILATCEAIAKHPGIGARKTALTPANVRFMPVSKYPNYVIVYTPETKPVRILAVIHGKRDFKTVVGQLG